MKVGEVCNREVVIVEAAASVAEAARLMREFHVGTVVATGERGGERVPLGILTDRDLVLRVLARKDAPRTVGEAMSRELLTAGEEDDLLDTLQRMQGRGVRRVPVVNGRGGLAGILALDDLLELVAEQVSSLVRLIGTGQARERQSHD